MKKLKVFIAEDEAIIMETLTLYLEKLGHTAEVQVLNASEFYTQVDTCQVDVAFLDIMFGSQPLGLTFGKYIQKHLGVPIVFVTSHTDKDTLQQVRDIGPAGYIVKPYKLKDIEAVLGLIDFDRTPEEETIEKQEQFSNSIFYRDKGSYRRIEFKNILYLKSEGNYLEIWESDQRHIVRYSIQSILNKLPAHFIRTHRSFIANMQFLESIEASYLLLKGLEVEIPIAKNYRSTVLKLVDIL